MLLPVFLLTFRKYSRRCGVFFRRVWACMPPSPGIPDPGPASSPAPGMCSAEIAAKGLKVSMTRKHRGFAVPHTVPAAHQGGLTQGKSHQSRVQQGFVQHVGKPTDCRFLQLRSPTEATRATLRVVAARDCVVLVGIAE
jgi:hypothetical protein